MALSQAYLEWERETQQRGLQQGLQQGVQQGLQQGVQQERQLVVENLLRARFGELDEALSAIVPSLMLLSPEEYTRLVLQSSREELLQRFQP